MSCKPNSFSQNLIRLMCDRCVLEMYPAFRVRTHHETGNARKFAKLLCQLGNPVDVQLGILTSSGVHLDVQLGKLDVN
jgi:hypothetical protein